MIASFLINRCPSTTIDMRTPKEVWSGHPPNLNRLKVFGCVAYAHIRQDKLEPRVVKCLFLGYLKGVKGIRVVVLKTWLQEMYYKS